MVGKRCAFSARNRSAAVLAPCETPKRLPTIKPPVVEMQIRQKNGVERRWSNRGVRRRRRGAELAFSNWVVLIEDIVRKVSNRYQSVASAVIDKIKNVPRFWIESFEVSYAKHFRQSPSADKARRVGH